MTCGIRSNLHRFYHGLDFQKCSVTTSIFDLDLKLSTKQKCEAFQKKSSHFNYFTSYYVLPKLNDPLRKHSIGHFYETGDIGTLYVIAITVFFLPVLDTGIVDVFHNGF